ncbi:ABC transporter permease, partial [Phytoactinopolyspora endophytica]|uniref:ABC transporter permease n=1 Tax=Phytoactinopolyspora endophytica TaxID=1642495 RepID=UPI00197C39A1
GVRALPGDTALMLAGQSGGSSDPEALEAVRRKYGLDQPMVIQYVRYMWLFLQGDLGVSSSNGLPVGPTIVDRLPVTAQLALMSLTLAAILGVGAGILAALWRGRAGDYLIGIAGLAGISVPSFWLALVLVIVFAVNLGWFPASGYVSFVDDPIGNLTRMVLPVCALATSFAAIYMRQMRSAMTEALQTDYIRTARAKGLARWTIIVQHGARNSLITILTLTGLQLGALISGAVVIEQVFVIPGYGKLLLDAVLARDYAVVQGVALVTLIAYVAISLLVDALYALVDPRVRTSGRA